MNILWHGNRSLRFPYEGHSESWRRGFELDVTHGNQDKRVQIHHGEEMYNEAIKHGNESNVHSWFQDSVYRYDVGEGLESDEHVSLMLTHTDEYESRIVEFFRDSLM